VECVACGGAAISERPERTAQGYRRFRCRDCGKQFNERTGGSLNRTQYPSDVIALVVFWRLRYKLSLRDLPEMFLLRGVTVTLVRFEASLRRMSATGTDTGTSTGRLMIAVLGGLADVERDLIRTRTAEGRSRAKACGQHMGRPPKLTPQQQQEARRRRAEGATLKELAKSYNVGRATISRLAV
jgi:hypothetical protein